MDTTTTTHRAIVPHHLRQAILSEAIAGWEAQEYRVLRRDGTTAEMELRRVYRLSALLLAGALSFGVGSVLYVLWIKRRRMARVYLEVDRYGGVTVREEK
jgi:hypothetical protein